MDNSAIYNHLMNKIDPLWSTCTVHFKHFPAGINKVL